jgi:hypothetical protein
MHFNPPNVCEIYLVGLPYMYVIAKFAKQEPYDTDGRKQIQKSIELAVGTEKIF